MSFLDPPDEPGMSPQAEEVWDMLEDAFVSTRIMERVCDIIDGLVADAEKECPVCLARMAEEIENER